MQTSHAVVDGRSTRWDDHRTARRDELVRAARRAVHHLGPDASMDEIATDAGTSKSVLYRYFADKHGLQAAVGRTVVEQMTATLTAAVASAPSARDALRVMVDTYLAMIEHSPNVYRFVTREAGVLPFFDAVVALVGGPYARATGASEAESDAWSNGAVGFIRGAGDWWLGTHDDAARPGAARTVVADMMTGWLWSGVTEQVDSRAEVFAGYSAGARGREPEGDGEGR